MSARDVGARRRIGVFGGSFDPPHAGHLHAARVARDAFDLDEVRFVPAARPPHKPGRRLVAGPHRVALLELLVEGEPAFRVDDRELGRPGPSFTVDTLREIVAETGAELYLILGTDNLPGLPEWREVAALLELAQPVIVHREGDPEALLGPARERLAPELVERLRAGLLELPPVEASSTEVRRALSGGDEAGEEVPERLRDYLRAHGLYTEP